MTKDKYNIELKVGDYVLLDSYTGMEYGTSAGKIVQIKKIGSRRISFDAGYTNLRSAQFEFCTAYNLIGFRKAWYSDYCHYLPLFSRTANSDQVYKSIVSKLKKGTDKELSEALIKNETYRYENRDGHYQSKNSGCAFGCDIKGMSKLIEDQVSNNSISVLETVGNKREVPKPKLPVDQLEECQKENELNYYGGRA